MTLSNRLKGAIPASAIHFLLSLSIAGCISFLVFRIWFPYPYSEIVGGKDIFWLIISVDVVCGPLLTFIVFNKNKPKRELVTDMGCIFLIQLAAIIYGIYSLWQTRPVFLAFEVDRFQIVTYADIKKEDLQPDVNPLHHLPWRGNVRLIGVRDRVIGEEDLFESLELSLQGYTPSFRPAKWQDYEKNIEDVKNRSRSVAVFLQNNPEYSDIIRNKIKEMNKKENDVVLIPVVSYRTNEWIALLDKSNLMPFAFLPIDGFQ